MAMAAQTLQYTASFSASPSRLFFSHAHDRRGLLFFYNPRFSPRRRFSVCRASVGRSRSGRKALSNAELRNELKEFLSSVGLPYDHVPSTKELISHGRNDLANVVRRRGYKLVTELLTNSLQIDVDGSDMKASLAEKQEQATPSGEVGQLAGQDEKDEDLAERAHLFDNVPVMELFPGSHKAHAHNMTGGNMYADQGNSFTLCTEKDSHFHSDISTSETISSVGVDAEEKYGDFNMEKEAAFSDILHPTAEISNNLDSDTEATSSLMGQVDVVDYNDESTSLSAYASFGEKSPRKPESGSIGDAGTSGESSYTSTLEEKEAKFLADGYLDPVEDNPSEIYDENGGAEPAGTGISDFSDSGNGLVSVISSENSIEVQPLRVHDFRDGLETLPETTSAPVLSPAKLHGNDHVPGDGLLGSSGNLVDTELHKGENQAEFNRLKYLLHQKEIELSRLKEEIETEKRALSMLQTKAENEINKVQKLILEKDAELLAAEESLSGLKEVEIQYFGDADIVEVSGSFNGWDHRIKLDPQPLASNTNDIGSRKPRLWSTMLWLYPGVYEIKFVVDGCWKVSREMESTTSGSICNNILRVNP